jgi:vancomycin resistance protein YoaR
MTTGVSQQTGYAPRQRSGMNPWWVRIPVLFITGGVLLLLVLGLFLMGFQMRHSERIFPGVQALGVDLGGLTQSEAAAALNGAFAYEDEAVFTFRDGDTFWQMTAADLGVSFDAEATAAQAFAIGHSGNPLRDATDQAGAWFAGYSPAPVVTYDQQTARQTLTRIAAEVARDPVNATLRLDGSQVLTTDSVTGRYVDVSATLAELDRYIMQMQPGAEIALVIREVPPVVPTVEQAADRLRAALSAPLQLTATDQTGAALGPWTVSTEQIAQLLTVSRITSPDGTQQYDIDISMTAFEAYLNDLAPGLIVPARDARYDFDPASGDLQVIQSSVSGRELNVTKTLQRLEDGVFTAESRIVPMAFDYTLPAFHNQVNAAELGIREQVAQSTTYFTGSSVNRRTNIAVSASRFNGLLIAPGEEFSFNYYLGDISEANGFVEGKVIVGGRTVNGLGGGVCQVSTTVFRAAFTGGFAITERNSHGYRVGYYELDNAPPGLDAAIWQPERDFKFQNNTPYHLLIETSVYPGDNALQFRFYSTQHWRADLDDAIVKNIEDAPPARYIASDELSPGEIVQVDYSADGADVTIYRDVYDMQGNLVTEDYVYTHYLPWQAIYEVAPTDSRLRNQDT